MCNAMIDLISPNGTPVRLTIAPGDDTDMIAEIVSRADKIGDFYASKGWTFANHSPSATGPSAGELASGPTFAGYPCSPTVNDGGLPTWIIVDGQQAHRREKQGDVWYSIKRGEGDYVTVLSIPNGEKAPPVSGIAPSAPTPPVE